VTAARDAACRFDHVIVGAADVDAGARHLERALGLSVPRSGSHPGRGTHNATAALAGGSYVEALAPDPDQAPGVNDAALRACDPPRLLAWVLRCEDMDAVTAVVAEVTGTQPVVEPGSRIAPTGETYRYLFAELDPRWPDTALPAVVQWNGPHPADGATSGVSWTGMRVETPDHEVVAELCRRLSLDVTVVPAESHRLVAVFDRDGHPVELA
jgi:hypothetical protein